jgi:hypothetical protein
VSTRSWRRRPGRSSDEEAESWNMAPALVIWGEVRARGARDKDTSEVLIERDFI